MDNTTLCTTTGKTKRLAVTKKALVVIVRTVKKTLTTMEPFLREVMVELVVRWITVG